MFYASAYPNSDISAGAMTAIAVVAVAALACWLIMVYVAAREPRKPRPTGQPAESGGAPAGMTADGLAEDEHEDEHKETVLRV
jgi:hypothetical protein